MVRTVSTEHFAHIAKLHAAVRDINATLFPTWDGLHYEWRLVDENGNPVAMGDYGEYPRFHTEETA
jgi:hypothetical protein